MSSAGSSPNNAVTFDRLGPAMIVAGEPAVADEVAGVLAFLGLRSQVVGPQEIAAYANSTEPWSAVMVCGAAMTNGTLKFLDTWADGPPLIIIDSQQPISERLARLRKRLHGRLDRPLRHARVVPLLEKLLHQPAGSRDVELFRSLVGQSAPVQQIRRMIRRVAPTDSTVLVLGETGTGKEVVARQIHYHSLRRDGPFVAVNCGAIPADLLESELFGHEKGAFTGALAARKGRFELARNGTLFLDEIGDMSFQMQVKLLRVLQERSFERLGGTQSIPADVRIVCATHRDLEQMVEKGTFRGDLFYRINVFPLEMPALRERQEDLPLLAGELISRLESEGRGSVRLSPDALAAISRHDWPGNVRELANLLERLSVLHPNTLVRAADLPKNIRKHALPEDAALEDVAAGDVAPGIAAPPAAASDLPANAMPAATTDGLFREEYFQAKEAAFGDGFGLKEYLNAIEEELIQKALAESGGTVAGAAKALGMRRTTLVEKLRKFGIDRLGFASEI